MTRRKHRVNMTGMERYRAEWAANLVERRETLHLTQAEVAESVGVTRQTVHYWETGQRSPRDHHKLALAVALRTTARALFPLIAPEQVAS